MSVILRSVGVSEDDRPWLAKIWRVLLQAGLEEELLSPVYYPVG